MSTTRLRVGVSVATGWTSPEAPRDIDAPALLDTPDISGWLGGLDFEGRLGLHDRTLTQLVEGEPVDVIEERREWVRVAALWQPAIGTDTGYLSWVRRAHLRQPNVDDGHQPKAHGPSDRL